MSWHLPNSLCFFAIPAEFEPLSLHCTTDEGASNKHSPLALASAAPALSLSMIARAESTGQTTNPDLTVPHSYGSLLQEPSPQKHASNEIKRRRGIRAPRGDTLASENHQGTSGISCGSDISNLRLRAAILSPLHSETAVLPIRPYSSIAHGSVRPP